jgi:hypothetical protein
METGTLKALDSSLVQGATVSTRIKSPSKIVPSSPQSI